MGGEGTIVVEHGQVGGKLQCSVDVVTEGKNPGKKNETTPIQQAANEAEAKWRKKQEREGYVEDLARAEAGETDAEGGIPPMLAKTFEDVKPKYQVFPAHGQRKLNGVRCIVQVDDGKVSLWSRKRKPLLGVPHVLAAYERRFYNVTGTFKIDGELYRHGWSLQKISGYVRKEGTKPGFEQISHNVYDIPVFNGANDHIWKDRQEDLDDIFHDIIGDQPEIKKVETIELRDAAHMEEVTTSFIKEGYEGLMYRNLETEYEPDVRSYGLLKVKRWQDAEFPITAVNEGRGKFAGLAVFTCKTKEGAEFDCCAPGNFQDREEFLRQGDALIGKMLTVKFFEWTEEKKPCFPVGMAVRDYE
jgi:DNA ligase-1